MNELFKRMYEMSFQAGEIALKYFGRSHPRLKDDRSVVTVADKEISQMIHASLKDLLQTSEHLIIDEESPEVADYLNQEKLNKIPYIWAVDPIDGTRLYANGMRFYSVSIGILKDLKPWMGVVYFPSLGELFCCDGTKAFFIQNAFTPQEKKSRIVPVDQTISSQSIFLADDAILKDYNWDYKDCQICISACASVDLCWPSTARGCGALFKSALWDFAGSWPIIHAAGLHLRSIKTKEVLDKLDVSLFTHNGRKIWQVKDYYILSSQRNYLVLKGKLTPR